MKRFVTSLVISLCILAYAIPAAAQFRWGPSVGMSVNNLKFKQELFDVSKGFLVGT